MATLYEAPRTVPGDERSTEQREREKEKNQRVSRADLSMHAGMGLGVGCEVAAPTCQCTDAGVRTSTTLRHSIWSRVSAMGSWEADGWDCLARG